MALLWSIWSPLLLGGCVRDVANRYYLSERLAPKAIEEVEVLRSAPSVPYEVIADLQARGESDRGMQKRAAEIGADAIIVGRPGGSFDSSHEWAGDPQSSFGSRVIGTAIRYKK